MALVIEKLPKMKTVLSVLGAFAFAFCISSTKASEVETEVASNFMDLPAELQLDIFELLDFKDLIHLSKVHANNRNLIERVFRNMFKNHTFRIYYDGADREVSVFYDELKIAKIDYGNLNENFHEIWHFLQYFGHCITKLEIKYFSYIDRKLSAPLHKQIRKYVAEFVSEINFRLDDKSINSYLDDLIVPFSNAEVVKLSNATIDVATLHQMFPAVQSLDLSSIGRVENLRNFPNLKRFKVPNYWGASPTHLPAFEQTLELNPQLKHLSIQLCSQLNVFQSINKFRPGIESFEVSNLNIYDDVDPVLVPLRFADMKVFKCIVTYLSQREGDVKRIPLEFGNLEEIEFNRRDLTDEWVDIMIQNSKLRKVTAQNILQREHLERIATGLPNLEEFSMVYDVTDPKSVRDVVDFLQSANQLKKATFFRLGKKICNEAAQQVSNEWKTVTNDWDLCCFARKKF